MTRVLSILTVFALLLSSCLEDNEFASSNIKQGATINIPADAPYISGVTQSVDLVINATQFSDVSLIESVTVLKSFSGPSGSAEGIEVSSVTTFPSTLSLDLETLLSGTGVNEGDLGPGDVWTFVYKVNLTDGRVLSPQGNTDVAFSCTSEIPEGTWNSVTTGTAGTNVPYTVTITETAVDGVYDISDITFGLYANGYGSSDNPAQFSDVCDIISVTNQPDVVYGGDVFNGTGTLNGDGTITLTWSNGYGDNGVTTLTKQ